MCWQLRNQIVQDIVLPTFISSLESVSYLVESVLQNVRLGDDEGLRTAVEHGTLAGEKCRSERIRGQIEIDCTDNLRRNLSQRLQQLSCWVSRLNLNRFTRTHYWQKLGAAHHHHLTSSLGPVALFSPLFKFVPYIRLEVGYVKYRLIPSN